MISIITAGTIAVIVAILGTPATIRLLVKRGYGQLIRDDGPTSHHTKRGTPTMGGAVIIVAAVAGYAGAHLARPSAPSASGLLVLFLLVGLGLVGFLDDYIKISKQRSLGLRSGAKMSGQVAVAVAFGIMALNFPDEQGYTPGSEAISFLRDTPVALPAAAFVIWALLMVAGASNAVNLTDGLDGLATGASVMVFGAYTLISVWQFNQSCAVEPGPGCYEVRDPLDLAVLSAALMGACFGFLWWNAAPAKIFMGDTGSLALGGALAGLAITSRTELLLIVLGGLFAVITLSVILQVGWFKVSRGKRLFRMAPLQHHFELKGWGEVTIVIRFWIIAGLFVMGGAGLFYAEWVATL
ncbi:phospho-N-acetylmuramoyl-pentapeptide-transferase [Actinobacteria bacterium YIM 96077]|uniref:Phospho-N-acetylmuramoyl-pentapeptide-transferase n=1 Tax=Phytoactinopolyspora halophila TaxID=1981511 RepID=A0A329QWK9_9ACTN|nr:phospho-N-acetylmuramoyl-pentapeptide-transferase [Phytoactinopolyspora halophila]AYY12841.1 phospho-N-acetylmuramoyl-pentapeptide-transferase [Actinobacteria bacterium YIM 96077]RAW16366.1 phospho-N-acetylmuramoyl-pentapeptide-transferase [Phytoactinopolyspora halophila]